MQINNYVWENDLSLNDLVLKQKESIIKEVRNKIENTTINCDGVAEDLIDDILEILDKGE